MWFPVPTSTHQQQPVPVFHRDLAVELFRSSWSTGGKQRGGGLGSESGKKGEEVSDTEGGEMVSSSRSRKPRSVREGGKDRKAGFCL